MVDKKLLDMANKVAGEFNSEKDFEEFTKALRKQFWESTLEGELDDHLGYAKHETRGNGIGNSRNGKSRKRIHSEHGELEIEPPRDRNGTFEPQAIAKRQSRTRGIDDKILFLYAKGQSTRDIATTIEELYDVSISPTLISRVTERVMESVVEWQHRPLDPLYPILYLDCIVLKIRHNQRVINKSLYLALGVDIEGHKQLLGMWLAENEGAKFWLSVLTELKARGLNDVLIACVDGLRGFPEAIAAEYPDTKIQLCIVHMVRNSLKLVPWKDYKAVTIDLKLIYQASTEMEAQAQLEQFEKTWDDKYPQISKSWRGNWHNLIAIYDYPAEIRKVIYTTNAIESLNSVIRKSTRNRKIFPDDQSALKVVYLAIQEASKKWTMPIRNWKPALNRFSIEFGERVTDHL
jgi:transposase-like protein